MLARASRHSLGRVASARPRALPRKRTGRAAGHGAVRMRIVTRNLARSASTTTDAHTHTNGTTLPGAGQFTNTDTTSAVSGSVLSANGSSDESARVMSRDPRYHASFPDTHTPTNGRDGRAADAYVSPHGLINLDALTGIARGVSMFVGSVLELGQALGAAFGVRAHTHDHAPHGSGKVPTTGAGRGTSGTRGFAATGGGTHAPSVAASSSPGPSASVGPSRPGAEISSAAAPGAASGPAPGVTSSEEDSWMKKVYAETQKQGVHRNAASIGSSHSDEQGEDGDVAKAGTNNYVPSKARGSGVDSASAASHALAGSQVDQDAEGHGSGQLRSAWGREAMPAVGQDHPEGCSGRAPEEDIGIKDVEDPDQHRQIASSRGISGGGGAMRPSSPAMMRVYGTGVWEHASREGSTLRSVVESVAKVFEEPGEGHDIHLHRWDRTKFNMEEESKKNPLMEDVMGGDSSNLSGPEAPFARERTEDSKATRK